MGLFSIRRKPEDLSRSEWESLIDNHILGRNSLRDRDILKESLLNGRTYAWIAEKWDMSDRQIARIAQNRMQELFKKI